VVRVVARRVATTMRRTIMLLYDHGEAAGEYLAQGEAVEEVF
jgi:hypothetical protein